MTDIPFEKRSGRRYYRSDGQPIANCKHLDVTCSMDLTGYILDVILSTMKPTPFLTSAKTFLYAPFRSGFGQPSPTQLAQCNQHPIVHLTIRHRRRQSARPTFTGYEAKLHVWAVHRRWDMDIVIQ